MSCSKLNHFCFVCGHQVVKPKTERNLLTPDFKKAYKLFFDEPDLSSEVYTPNIVCRTCYVYLMDWKNGRETKSHIRYCKPVIWINISGDHDESNCYACINFTFGLNAKNKKNKTYIAAATAILPVIAPDDFTMPKQPSPDRES